MINEKEEEIEIYKIPLRNNKQEIVDYSFVDEIDFNNVNKYKWNKVAGYARGIIDNINIGLHQFIIGKAINNQVIDHINGNKLDNRKDNLIFSTRSQNSQNRPKLEGGSSKYIGVQFDKKSKKWKSSSHLNGIQTHLGHFEDEINAAKKYDTFVLLHFGKNAKTNNLLNYEDIKNIDINNLLRKKERDLPCNIRMKCNSYEVLIVYNGIKYNKTLPTLEKAIDKLKEFQDEIEIIKQKEIEEHYNKEITRNEFDIAIIPVKNNKGEIIDNFMVDDNKWYDIMKYKWSKSNNYFVARINGKMINIHRYLMNANKNDIIDHIDKNTKNNQMNNLRVSNESLNTHNRTKKANTTSKYYGVSWNKKDNIWIVSICKDNVKYYLGSFDNENEAAMTYNKKAVELYGEFANLNII